MEVKESTVEKREEELFNPLDQQTIRAADQDDQAKNGSVEDKDDESNEVEKNKVRLLRALVENQDSSCKVPH